jgi:acyl carrier protein
VDQTTALNQMKTFFEDKTEPEVLQRFAETPSTELLEESIDVVEFIVYLEDELKIKIDSNKLGPAVANMTFGELAAELCRQEGDKQPA